MIPQASNFCKVYEIIVPYYFKLFNSHSPENFYMVVEDIKTLNYLKRPNPKRSESYVAIQTYQKMFDINSFTVTDNINYQSKLIFKYFCKISVKLYQLATIC